MSETSLIAGLYGQLQHNEFLLIIAGSALATHAMFKRWEPTAIPIVISLLLLLPTALCIPLLTYYSTFRAYSIGFLAFYLTLATSIASYRLSPLHPLAQYPGPVACKLSKWPLALVSLRGTQHQYIYDLHQKYGDAVRIGPNELSFRDAEAIQPLMGTNGLPKGPNWTGRALHPPIPPLIAERDPASHSIRRRPWNRGFGTAALHEYQPIVAKRLTQLVDALSEQKGVIDLAQWIGFFTYDFMADFVFGGGTEMMKNGDEDQLWEVIRRGFKVAMLYDHLPWLGHYAKLFPRAGEDTTKMRKMGIEWAKQRVKKGSTVKDLFYYINNEDQAEKVSPDFAQVVSNGAMALVAGSDTTSSVLSNLFWCLMKHPDIYDRLRAEIDQYYPRGADSLSIENHPQMVYLEAVINEALRLYPAVPSGSQRAPVPGTGGKAIGAYYVPEGTQARIHFMSVHRDPRYFSHPDTFWPDRWLIAEGLQEHVEHITHNPNAFIPFSFGPANCAGKKLALLEIKMVICHMVQNLEFHFPKGWDSSKWERDMADHLVIAVGELPVLVEKRV